MLTTRQIRFLRARAHHCDPVVRIGQNGLTDAVLAELDSALTAHELVKVRITGGDRAQRDQWIDRMCERTGAERVQRIGHTAALYRHNPDKAGIQLPGAGD